MQKSNHHIPRTIKIKKCNGINFLKKFFNPEKANMSKTDYLGVIPLHSSTETMPAEWCGRPLIYHCSSCKNLQWKGLELPKPVKAEVVEEGRDKHSTTLCWCNCKAGPWSPFPNHATWKLHSSKIWLLSLFNPNVLPPNLLGKTFTIVLFSMFPSIHAIDGLAWMMTGDSPLWVEGMPCEILLGWIQEMILHTNKYTI